VTKKSPAQARHAMKPSDLQRMQSATALKGTGEIPKGSHIGRIQRHVAQLGTSKREGK
jgi:hypothetical protein